MIFAAIADAGGVPLARVPKGNHDYIKRTLDAGAHWRDVTPAKVDAGAFVSGLFALDDRHAWMATAPGTPRGSCRATIFRTVDGGATWQRSTPPVLGCDSQHFTFVDSVDGWDEDSRGAAAGSEEDSVLRTNDGGASWQLMSYTGSLDARQPPTIRRIRGPGTPCSERTRHSCTAGDR